MLNNFSCEIKTGLVKCRNLTRVTLDYNLSGKVPEEFWEIPIDIISFLENPGFCEKIEDLFGCRAKGKKTSHVWLVRSIFIVVGFVSVGGIKNER